MITTATAPGGNRGYSKKTPIYRESDTSPTCGNPTSNLSGDAHWLRLVETSQIIGRWKSKYDQVKYKHSQWNISAYCNKELIRRKTVINVSVLIVKEFPRMYGKV